MSLITPTSNTKISIDKLLHEVIVDQYIANVVNEATTKGLAPKVRKAEMRVQYELLRQLSGGDGRIVDKLIDRYATIFRKAIKAYRKLGKVPTSDEIINFTNDEIRDNIIEIAKRMRI